MPARLAAMSATFTATSPSRILHRGPSLAPLSPPIGLRPTPRRSALLRRPPPPRAEPNSGNGNSPGPGSEEDPKRRELNLLLSLIVQYPAVRGSIAVAAGYLAHIDPLGTLHWNAHDAALGVALAAVPTALDLTILLPNWEPKRTTRKMKLMLPRAVAEKMKKEDAAVAAALAGTSTSSSSSTSSSENSNESTAEADSTSDAAAAAASTSVAVAVEAPPLSPPLPSGSDMVEVEREMPVRVDQHPLKDALLSIQMSRVMANVGRALSPASEAALLFLVHVSEEMLYRGVLLTLVVRWCTDTLYYAGVEESVVVPGLGLELVVPQLAALLGGVGVTAAAVGLLVQRELFPLRLLEAAKEQLAEMAAEERQEKAAKERERLRRLAALSGKTLPPVEAIKQADAENAASASSNAAEKKESAGDVDDESEAAKSPDKRKKFVMGLLERLRSGVVVQQRWIVAVEAAVELTQWSTLAASYLITGNILAPIAGSMANDAVYSLAQRVKHRQLREAMAARKESGAERAKQTAALLQAVREHRKARLEPPSLPRPLPKGMGFPEEGEDESKKEEGGEEKPSNGNDSGGPSA